MVTVGGGSKTCGRLARGPQDMHNSILCLDLISDTGYINARNYDYAHNILE